MADTAVDTSVFNGLDNMAGLWGPYWKDTTTGVIIYIDSLNDLAARETTDSGATWSKTVIQAGNIVSVACWLEKATPGLTADIVHIAFSDADANDLSWNKWTIGTGAGAKVDLENATFTCETTQTENKIGITVARSGDIYIMARSSTNNEAQRSTDAGATWNDITKPTNLSSAWAFTMYPAGSGVSNEDIVMFHEDRSSNIGQVRMYDQSANTWTTTAAPASVWATNWPNHGGMVRNSDGAILIAYCDNGLAAGNDLKSVEIVPNSIASPTVTAKTDLETNNTNMAGPTLFIDQVTDDVYVALTRGTSWFGTVDIDFYKSTDDMATWSTVAAYSEDTADDLRRVHSGAMDSAGADGARWQPVFYNDDLNDIFVNLTNDVQIETATFTITSSPSLPSMTMSAVAAMGANATSAPSLPSMTMAAVASSGDTPIANAIMTFASMSMAAVVTEKSDATAAITLPSVTMAAVVEPQIAAAVGLTLPSLTMVSYGHTLDAVFVLTLDATSTVTVTVDG